MPVSSSRALEIVKNQSNHLASAKFSKVPQNLRVKLLKAADSLTPQMIGGINPNSSLCLPQLIGVMGDIGRLRDSGETGAKALAGGIFQLFRGLQAMWQFTNDEGLILLQEICEVIDQIADEIVIPD